jgi:hypothetical protein
MVEELWSLEVRGCCWKFQLSGQIGIADLFDLWAFIPEETKEAQNTTTVGNFPTFPWWGIALDFGIGRRISKPWKLGRETGDLNKFLFLMIATLLH